MSRIYSILICAAVAFMATSANADVVMLEDFEDATVHYSQSHADNLGDIVNRDWYGRASLADFTGTDVYLLNGIGGSRFFGAEDMDGVLGGEIPNQTPLQLDFSVNIANFDNLVFDLDVAEDAATDGFQDWDDTDQFLVTYQIDNGGYTNLFSVQAEAGGSTVNKFAREDTNFDGFGDGTFITDTFANFSKNIIGTGSTLDLRIQWVSNTFAGDEDLSIDNVRISGDPTAVPEPGTLLLLGCVPFALMARRKRKLV